MSVPRHSKRLPSGPPSERRACDTCKSLSGRSPASQRMRCSRLSPPNRLVSLAGGRIHSEDNGSLHCRCGRVAEGTDSAPRPPPGPS
eukprot:398322-Prorocentrum_minimum.AAC.1